MSLVYKKNLTCSFSIGGYTFGKMVNSPGKMIFSTLETSTLMIFSSMFEPGDITAPVIWNIEIQHYMKLLKRVLQMRNYFFKNVKINEKLNLTSIYNAINQLKTKWYTKPLVQVCSYLKCNSNHSKNQRRKCFYCFDTFRLSN